MNKNIKHFHNKIGGFFVRENINTLDELNKGACMGMDAIHFVLDKVEDELLKNYLNMQYQKYEKISKKINDLYPKYDDGQPHETSVMNKAMTWYGIEIKTFLDKSTSKIAELLMQGTNMGIIEGRKLINHKNMSEDVKKLVEEYVSMQEDSIENLKKFL